MMKVPGLPPFNFCPAPSRDLRQDRRREGGDSPGPDSPLQPFRKGAGSRQWWALGFPSLSSCPKGDLVLECRASLKK